MVGEPQGVRGLTENVGPASYIRDVSESRRQPEPASNNSRSYWDYYVDADIPWYERVLAGAALPIVAPLLLVGSLTGCGGEGESYPRTGAGRNTGPDTGRDAGHDAGQAVNHPPSLSPIANQTVMQGQSLSLTVAASDPDGTTPILSSGQLPEGATFNHATGVFEWNQIAVLPGNYSIVFTASDGQAMANQTVSIQVLEARATQIAAGGGVCALLENGAVTCWGNGVDYDFGQLTPPSGVFFTRISMGRDVACGILGSGAIQCWGYNEEGQATAPPGDFIDVSAGTSFACGVHATTGAIRCWGYNGDGQATPPLHGDFTQVTAGDNFACGILDTGAIECWGSNEYGQSSPPAGNFSQVNTASSNWSAWNFACGVRDTGEIQCWGYDTFFNPIPTESFIEVSPGSTHVCGLLDSGAIQCWGGGNGLGHFTFPAGTFTDLSSGDTYTCAVRTNGKVECAGGNAPTTPPFLSQ